MAHSLTELKRKGYNIQRTASLGAAITLVSRCNDYAALFECATKCAQVLGDRALEDVGDGILEVIPYYRIPAEDLCTALQKLSTRFSISLVEFVFTRQGGKFITLWRIDRQTTTPHLPSTNLDDY